MTTISISIIHLSLGLDWLVHIAFKSSFILSSIKKEFSLCSLNISSLMMRVAQHNNVTVLIMMGDSVVCGLLAPASDRRVKVVFSVNCYDFGNQTM